MYGAVRSSISIIQWRLNGDVTAALIRSVFFCPDPSEWPERSVTGLAGGRCYGALERLPLPSHAAAIFPIGDTLTDMQLEQLVCVKLEASRLHSAFFIGLEI